MSEREDTHQLMPLERRNEHWRSMQSAYQQYTRASEALEFSAAPDDDPYGEERTRLEAQQRLAFERYLESRMEFLESRFDETYPPGPRPALPETAPRFAFLSRPALCALAAVLLLTTAFSFARARSRIRDLEASRDDLRVRLQQTRDGLQALTQKVDTWEVPAPAPLRPAMEPVVKTPVAAPRRKPTTIRKTSGEARRYRAGHPPQKNVPITQAADRRHVRRPS
jgi:hypothetical protein